MAYQKPKLYGMRIGDKDFTSEIYYLLEEVEGGTRLNSEAHMEFSGNIIARFIGRMAVHHNRTGYEEANRSGREDLTL